MTIEEQTAMHMGSYALARLISSHVGLTEATSDLTREQAEATVGAERSALAMMNKALEAARADGVADTAACAILGERIAEDFLKIEKDKAKMAQTEVMQAAIEALGRSTYLLDAAARFAGSGQVSEFTVVYDDVECDGDCLSSDCLSAIEQSTFALAALRALLPAPPKAPK